MTPVPETLLLTLDVELGQKSSLKCKQLWYFITKFTIVFQNTPYYKLQGHLCLPPVTISAPGGASSVELGPGKGDVETAGVSASEITPSFAVWQRGFVQGNPERDFHIVLLNRNKKRVNATSGSNGSPSSFEAFQELYQGGSCMSARDGQRQKGGTSATECLGWS